MNFQKQIAVAVRDELLSGRYTARNLNHLSTGRVFWVLPTTKTNYANFVKDHPDYRSGDGVVTVAAVYNTIDAAIGACTAAQGDTIYVGEGHTETVTATSIAHDISGISIIGLGKGLLRPTFTFGAAAATITVSAANSSWENCHFIANFADVAAAFTLGAAKDFRLANCTFADSGTDKNYFNIVVTGSTDNATDGLTVVGNRWINLDANSKAFISILGNCDRLLVTDNFVDSAGTTDIGHFITMGAEVCLGARIMRNELILLGATGQTVGIFITGSSTTSTGIVAYNLVTSLDTTTELFDTATLDFAHFENYYTGVIAKSGYLVPAADSAA